jgi:hypothetical protein
MRYFGLLAISIATLLWASYRRGRRKQSADNEYLRRHAIWLDRKGGL